MRLREVIWKDWVVDKLELKHGVSVEEVEQVLFSRPHVRRLRKGHVRGEDLYAGYGRTAEGRYLVALPVSARDMTASERRHYERQAEAR